MKGVRLRGNWSLVLAILFLALLGSYLLYTEQIIRAFRAETATMTRMFAEVQAGLADPDPLGSDNALSNLQAIILESGVPLILAGPGDTIYGTANLPFEANLATPAGQRRVREYARRMGARNPPVGDPTDQLIYFGDSPELQRLRWVPWLQVGALLLTFLLGVTVFRAQRRAEADRAWTSMARELAHQLGTPISSLQGWLEVLRLPRRERPGDVQDTEIAAEIGEDVERLGRVSRRFELIGRDPELAPLELDRLVGSMERYIGARMPRLGPGIELVVELAPDLPRIQGNEVLLSWALENLVKNALDALAGRGGRIVLRGYRRDPEWVTLEVEDSGAGVDPAIRDRLFEPGVSTKTGGWGVGLSLSRRIVERVHRGRIELLTSGPEGTVFQLLLPVADE